jgi:hypothetical protein
MHQYMYRKSTNSSANLPSPMFWHKLLHQDLRADTFKQQNRLGISVFTVLYWALPIHPTPQSCCLHCCARAWQTVGGQVPAVGARRLV